MVNKHLLNINKTIDYFSDVNNFLSSCEEIDLSWVVREDISNITKPKHRENFPFKENVLVASGEQSFIQLMVESKLKENFFYIGITPCFRDEKITDDTHFNYFIKAELFCYGKDWDKSLMGFDSNLAYEFAFASYRNFKNLNPSLNLSIIKTDEAINSYDIMAVDQDVELGSYGSREIVYNNKSYYWTYGTAIAEPRFSNLLIK